VLSGRGGSGSELEEHVFPLIYELHKVHPGFMLYILPHVSSQLSSEDTPVRQRAVGKSDSTCSFTRYLAMNDLLPSSRLLGPSALLGRLFAAPAAEYGVTYHRIFREFLGRFRDKEAIIRSQMIGIGAYILEVSQHAVRFDSEVQSEVS
jgi:hypothetical protein